MIIADRLPGPALSGAAAYAASCRWGSPIKTGNFSMGFVTLDPNGGQVPWHNQEQEEVYCLMLGRSKPSPFRRRLQQVFLCADRPMD
jgi:hypothetical protein